MQVECEFCSIFYNGKKKSVYAVCITGHMFTPECSFSGMVSVILLSDAELVFILKIQVLQVLGGDCNCI